MKQLKLKYVIAAVPIFLLLMVTAPVNAQAYWGGWNGGWGGHYGYGGFHGAWGDGHYGYGDEGMHLLGGLGHMWGGHEGGYQNGYNLGQQDAVYDHENNLAYNPIGNCIPCHSQEYWNNFKQGYDSQWNSYSHSQEQTSTQGASINIYGNNYGTASIGQTSNNEQGQDQQGGPSP